MISEVGVSPGALTRALFGPGVVVEVDDPAAPPLGLRPDEEVALVAAVDRRRREFAAGRRCARRALVRLGHSPVSIPPAGDRAPVWPAGVVGSITHTERWCAAVVAPRARARSIGLDAEPAEPLPESLWPEVLTGAERSWLTRRPPEERGLWARLIFSAKEAVYKCQYPLTRQVLDFHHVQLSMAASRSATDAVCAVLTDGTRLAGRYVWTPSVLVTGVLVPAGAAPPTRGWHHPP